MEAMSQRDNSFRLVRYLFASAIGATAVLLGWLAWGSITGVEAMPQSPAFPIEFHQSMRTVIPALPRWYDVSLAFFLWPAISLLRQWGKSDAAQGTRFGILFGLVSGLLLLLGVSPALLIGAFLTAGLYETFDEVEQAPPMCPQESFVAGFVLTFVIANGLLAGVVMAGMLATAFAIVPLLSWFFGAITSATMAGGRV